MMLPRPRIIAIDDDPKHLEVLVQGLSRCGTTCLPIHFEGETESITPCPHIRVIFADLHLISGGSPDGKDNNRRHFNLIGSLIEENIKPSGPYFIVLWTRYSDEADELHRHLIEELKDVAKPFTVQALDKKDYLNLVSGDVKENKTRALVQNLRKSVDSHPQFGALLNWEERVLDGAADTLSSIMEMVHGPDKTDTTAQEIKQASALDPADPGKPLGRLLRILAEGAVGRSHVQDDRFRAVNDALLPILADRLASMRSQDSDDKLWKNALNETSKKDNLSIEEAARLNRFLHIETLANNGDERGVVISLPEEFLDDPSRKTLDSYSKDMKDMFAKQFSSKLFDENTCSRWILVQTQASCDYAQNRPGLLPLHLGLLIPKSSVSKNTPPASLWRSPCFEYDQQAHCLHVSALFPVSLSRERARQMSALFRLREQLLNDLIYYLHGYGARPGFISF